MCRLAGPPSNASIRGRRSRWQSSCSGKGSATRSARAVDDKDKYYNHLLFRMEQLLYHELSDCASWKTELIGTDFIQTQDIQGKSEQEIIDACIAKLKAAGLVKD